jgi:hypothetical protein
MSVTVSVSSGTATLTATKNAGVSVSNTTTLIDNIGFVTTADGFNETNRTITITNITDSGSNVSPSSNTISISQSSTVMITTTNDAPTTVGSIAPQPFYIGENGQYTVSLLNFYDPDSTIIIGNLSATGLPDGLYMEDNVIRGTPPVGSPEADYEVTITASDGTYSTDLIFTIEILQRPPQILLSDSNTKANSNTKAAQPGIQFDFSNNLNTFDPFPSTSLLTLNDVIRTATSSISPITLATAEQLRTISIKADGVSNAVTQMMNEGRSDPSQIANNLYEVAVSATQVTGKTDLLKEVVSTIVVRLDMDDPSYTVFLNKFVLDSRLSDAQKLEVVKQLIATGRQDVATLIMSELDRATTLKIGIQQSDGPSGANCTP